MKRAHGHLAFGAATAAFALVTAGELVRLHYAQEVNAAIAEWAAPSRATASAQPNVPTATSRVPTTTSAAPSPARATAAAAQTTSSTSRPAKSNTPEAYLSHALSLSNSDYDGALAAYKSIIQANREDLRRIALYDLGNLHLRQALHLGQSDEAQSLPLTELAKQSYRDALRRDPNDWDARYNLERALRLAPEEDESDADEGPPDNKEHERTTIADPRMDLP